MTSRTIDSTGDTLMNYSLLIVEDNLDQLEMLELWFKRAGFSVVPVTTGAAALAAVAKQDFGVALLDLGLPDCDGIDLMRGLIDHQPTLQVIVLSGRTLTPWHARIEGAVACIQKPYMFTSIQSAVEDAFDNVCAARSH